VREFWLSVTGTPWFVVRVFFVISDYGKIAIVVFNKIGFTTEPPFFRILAVIFGTVDFASVLTPVQLIVLELVSMLYIPCIAVILVLASDFGWRKALAI
jgi:Fe2+ transport system protein B